MAANTFCGTGIGGIGPLPGDPDNNSILSAVPAFGGIDVFWTWPGYNPQGVAYVNLYRATAGTAADATHHAVVDGNFFYDKSTTATAIQYFYWIEIVSVNGTRGAWIGPASATAMPTMHDVLVGLTGKIDSGALSQELKSEIARLDLLDTRIDDEIQARLADIAALGTSFTEVQAHADATRDQLVSERQQRQAENEAFVEELNQRAQEIAQERDDRAAAIAEEAQLRIDGLATERGLRLQQIQDEAQRWNSEIDTLRQEVEQVEAGLTAEVSGFTTRLDDTEATLLEDRRISVEADTAHARRLGALEVTQGDQGAAITGVERVLAEQDLVEAIQFEAIETTRAGAKAAVYTERTSRIAEDLVQAQRTDSLVAELGDTQAQITQEATARSDGDNILSSQIGELSAKVDALPQFASGFEAGGDFDQWEVGANDTLTAELSDTFIGLQSALVTSSKTNAAPTDVTHVTLPEGVAAAMRGFGVKIRVAVKQPTTNAASEFAIAYDSTAGNSGWFRYTPNADWQEFEINYTVPEGADDKIALWGDTSGAGKGVLLDAVSVRRIAGEVLEITAALDTEQQARIDGDTALASDLSALTTRVGDNEAGLITEAQTRADKDDALTSQMTAMQSRVGDAEANILAESQARSSKDSALTTQIGYLETSLNNKEQDLRARVTTEREARVSADNALSSRVDTLDTTVGDNHALILAESEARTTEDEALSSSIALLQSQTADDIAAAVGSEEQARTTADTAMASRVDSLEATVADDIAAAVSQSNKAWAEGDKALAERQGLLEGEVEENAASIFALERVTVEQALADTIQAELQEAHTAAGMAQIRTERRTRVDADGALGERIDEINVTFGGNMAGALEHVSNYVDNHSATAQKVETLEASVTGPGGLDSLDASLNSLRQATVDTETNTSLVSRLNELIAELGGTSAEAVEYLTSQVDQYSATAQGLSQLRAEVDDPDSGLPGMEAQLTSLSEATVDKANQRSLVSQMDQMQATITDPVTGLESAHARIEVDALINAEQDAITAIQANLQEVHAAADIARSATIVEYNRTQIGYCELGGLRSSHDTPIKCIGAGGVWVPGAPLAESVKQVSIDDGDGAATVEQKFQAYRNRMGDLGAQYTAKVDVNGLVGGFGIYNDGTEVEAGFDVDRFWVGRTNANKIKPFIIEGGVTFINEAAINKLTFNKLRADDGSFIVHNGKIKAKHIDAGSLHVASAAYFSGPVEFSQVKGLGGLASQDNVSYGKITGTKPPSNADRTSSNTAYDTHYVSGKSASVVRNWAQAGANGNNRVNSWTRPGSTEINGNKISTADAYVDTLQIKGNAVTMPLSAYNANLNRASGDASKGYPATRRILNAPMPSGISSIELKIYLERVVLSKFNNKIILKRGGSTLRTWNLYKSSTPRNHEDNILFLYQDNTGNGGEYEVFMQVNNGSGGGGGSLTFFDITGALLNLTGFKR